MILLGYILITLITLKVLNFGIFAIFDYFREILYPCKVSKAESIPAEFEILFLIFDQIIILIAVYHISILIVTKLEFL